MTTDECFPDVTLHADGLTLRPFVEADVPAVVEACTDPVTLTWLPLPTPYTEEVARGFVSAFAPSLLASGRGVLRAVEVDGELAGAIDLKRADWAARVTEIGYWAHPGSRGRGVMSAATRLLSRWALRDIGFQRVELRIATGNTASLRVAERAGFTREGVLRNAGYVHAGRVDLEVWSLVPADLADRGTQRRMVQVGPDPR